MTSLAKVTSSRVKHCDLHETTPWVVTAHHDGKVKVLDCATREVIFEHAVSEAPVRCAKFIERQDWIVCGDDSGRIYVLDARSGETVSSFVAHTDYIRSLDVHPSEPLLLSSADDKVIKLWNWAADWECVRTFSGHEHYVMHVEFSPLNPSLFASASLDTTAKVWQLDSESAIATLRGHSKGLNWVSFVSRGDKLFLITAADDAELMVWDFATEQMVCALEGHTANVSTVGHQPGKDVVLTGSEDGTVRLWNVADWGLAGTMELGLQRCWAIGMSASTASVVAGCDDGAAFFDLAESAAARL